jgi:hypothetical protein
MAAAVVDYIRRSVTFQRRGLKLKMSTLKMCEDGICIYKKSEKAAEDTGFFGIRSKYETVLVAAIASV